MVELGVVLAVMGAALMVAEAHVPGGVLGTIGGVTLAIGAALALAGAGGGAAVVVGVILGLIAASGVWLYIATRKTLATRRLRLASGREALPGRCGVVRRWQNGDGQVFVDGALWRARRWELEGEPELRPGDPVVIEQVSGLTLTVRPAEEWEVAP